MSDTEIIKPDPSLPYAEQPGLVLAALTLYGEARGEKALGKKAVLFVMVDDTKNCDEVGAHLERICTDLQGAVLVGMLAIVVDMAFERLSRRIAWNF